jgi:hypothetical protein
VGTLGTGETPSLTVAAARAADAELPSGKAFVIAMKSPGNLPESYGNKLYQVAVVVKTTDTELDGVPDITVALESYEMEGNLKVNVTTIESITGGFKEGCQIDGEDYDIATLLYNSTYFQGVFDYTKTLAAVNTVIPYTQEAQVLQTPEVLTTAYNTYFRSIESSIATILIDPGTTAAEEANRLIALAAYRQNCVAVVGYPASAPLTQAAVEAYKQTLVLDMFGVFVGAVREKVTIGGRKYASNAIGSYAGDLAAVANAAGVNQLPSAKSYGSTSMVLTSKFTFDEILAMHNKGIVGCYDSVDGPRWFGLRSLYKRPSSYFSKFNVSRVCARILTYAFGVAIDAIHTGNTDARKALTQTNLQADVERLIADGALRVGSKVQCDQNNNKDVDTNGGEYLIIDYTCYFVKLIERVKIRITATDNSVSADISM